MDPTLDVEEIRRRWEVRAAQWRARELAEAVFEGEVVARLSGRSARGAFRGLLHLEVPFADLASHRSREARFLASAGEDPVLSRVPLIVVFSAAVR
jgi:hypothetical protein